jgi:hypothetical protein
MPMGNSFFFALFVRVFKKKNSGQLQRKSENSDKFFAFMYKCHLTAGCQIVNQTNRVVYLNIDLAIEI